MSLRKAVTVILLVSMLIMITGCATSTNTQSSSSTDDTSGSGASTESSTSNSEDETSEDAITIEFWNSWSGSDGDVLVDLVNQFNEENEWGITINMDISSSLSEKLSTTLPTSDASPLILIGNGDRYKYQDYLLDMNDVWDNTSLNIEDFNENSIETGYIGDDLYSLPFQNSVYYLYWNKDLFEQAGLDPESPPESFEEWTEMAEQITNPDANVYGSGLFFSYGTHQMSLMQKFGGLAVEAQSDGTYKVNIANNEGYKEYLEWEKDLYDREINPLEIEIDSMFKANQIGIMVNGPWLAPGADESGVNFGMTKIFGEEPIGDVAGFYITSSATDEEKLACERFMQWWYQGNEGTSVEDTAISVWSLKNGFPTTYLPTANCDAYLSNERLSALNLDDNSKDSIWIATSPDFKGWSDVVSAIGSLSEAVIYGTSIDEALETAQETAEEAVINYEGEDALAK